jgi:poly(A)-specific ribonuclease
MPFLNKLYLMRMLDISYLNISGTDLTPSRDHVFHVNCPKEATTKSILDIFSPFGQVQVRWQDDNNLFVSLQDKDQAPLVIKNIEYDKLAYNIIPFAQYQSSAAKMIKRPLGNNQKPKQKGWSSNSHTGNNNNPKGPRQHSSASTSSTSSGSGSEGGSVSPPLPETVHHQKKKRPKTEKSTSSSISKGKAGGDKDSCQGEGKPPNSSSSLHFEEPSTWD